MPLDRTIAPPVKTASFHPVRPPDIMMDASDQGRRLVAWHNPMHPYLRIQFVFPFAAEGYPRPLVPGFTAELLSQGTQKRSWKDITEAFDFYGTYLSHDFHNGQTVFTIYCLHKFLNPVLELLEDVFLYASFPEEPFDRLKEKQKQNFKTSLNKVSVLSSREMNRLRFQGTPLERLTEESDFEQITRTDLEQYFKEYYLFGPEMVCVSGGSLEHTTRILDFINSVWKHSSRQYTHEYTFDPKRGIHYVKKTDALQSSIRLSIPVPDYVNSDFPLVYVLNMLLGGYFGSRLMQTLREEKGFTYGIGSSFQWVARKLFLNIHTEVATEYTRPALEDIFSELRRLQQPDYEPEELQNMARYMAGNLLERTNGLFENTDSWMNDSVKGITTEMRKLWYDTFFSVNPEQLMHAAAIHLKPDNFTVVVAGNVTMNE